MLYVNIYKTVHSGKSHQNITIIYKCICSFRARANTGSSWMDTALSNYHTVNCAVWFSNDIR